MRQETMAETGRDQETSTSEAWIGWVLGVALAIGMVLIVFGLQFFDRLPPVNRDATSNYPAAVDVD